MQFLKYLTEKLIMFHSKNGGNKYGNIVLLAGGGGSGKGFAVSNFLDGNLYKIRDVDEIKRFFIKLADVKNKNPELKNLDLRNPKNVFKIHQFVSDRKIKGKTFELLIDGMKKGRLPNILFDVTFKDAKPFKHIERLIEIGYDPKDVNLVWVLTNYAVAVKNNAGRPRVVPADIMLATHEGAALNMIKVLRGEFPQVKNKALFDGAIHVVLNNRENTLYWAGFDKKTKKAITTDDVKKAIKTKPTKAEMELYKKTDGKEGKKPQPVIADFKYLTLKEKGQGITDNETVLKQIQKWVIDNIPPTALTKTAWETGEEQAARSAAKMFKDAENK